MTTDLAEPRTLKQRKAKSKPMYMTDPQKIQKLTILVVPLDVTIKVELKTGGLDGSLFKTQLIS